jgi:3-oxoacyl-[acyl-carrier protein] reductase
MKAKLKFYSIIYEPPYPFKVMYAVGVVEDERGQLHPVRIEGKYISLLETGIEGEVIKESTVFGEVYYFIPASKELQQEKVVLVTGASRGIGRATALEFAKRGYNVAINDLELTPEGESAIREIMLMGGKAIFVKTDVSKYEEVESMVKEVINAFGRIDVLVNNAGINIDRLVINMTLEDWVKVIDVHLTGTFNCTKAVLPYMIKQGGGSIINVSSMSAFAGTIGQANYAAAKGGIVSFTKVIAREYARYNITCNAIAPGAVKTRMLLSVHPGILRERIAQIPLGRFAEPEEIAKVIAFLAETPYINGQVIQVNAGEYM